MSVLANSMLALAPDPETAALPVNVDAQDILARITGSRAQNEGNSFSYCLMHPVSSPWPLPLCHPFKESSCASRLDEARGRREKRVVLSRRLSDIAKAPGVSLCICIVPRSFRCHARTAVTIRIFRVACHFFAPSGRS
jgi:hypothetical protein